MSAAFPSPDSYQQAYALAQRGQNLEAENICRSILASQPDCVDALLLLAAMELQSGRDVQAIISLQRVVTIAPSQAIARAMLGDALMDQNRTETALVQYEAALKLEPTLLPALFGRANALLDLRRTHEALAGFDEVLRLNPNNPEGHFNRGNTLQELERLAEAVASYDQALALDPKYASAYNNRGGALLSAGEPDRALASFDAAIEIQPAFIDAMLNRGCALHQLRRREQALDAFDRTISLSGDYGEAHRLRGDVLLELNREEEALASHERAVEIDSNSSEALTSRGNSLSALRRFSEAIDSYSTALRLHPSDAATLCNRGNTLFALGRCGEALADFEAALTLQPGFLEALRRRGDVLLALQRLEAAAECFEQLLRFDPHYVYAPGALLHARRCNADWPTSLDEASSERVTSAILKGMPADSPFSFLAVTDSAAAQLKCAQTYIAQRLPPPPPPLWTGAIYRHRRIRLAYISADFRTHAVCYLLARVFEEHDRERFETVAISLRPAELSVLGRRVQCAFDQFIDVSGHGDGEVAKLLHSMEIDIAIDLTGFTEGLRPQILAHRPAPIQVNYLGYPGTLGSKHIDYILADDFVVPEAHARFFTEQVVHLPGCFQANDTRREAARAMTRNKAGLPTSPAFVFCCFNNTYKLNPDMFARWMRMLERVPGSVLWLLGEGSTRANLKREAALRAVDPERLIFAGRVPYAEHLGRLALADLYLDTLPFNAGATASDALWAGVPLLTCAGEAFAARMAGSLLRSAGLGELITHQPADYEALGVHLALQPQRLLELRLRLAKNRLSAPVFDTNLSRRALESAYEKMWQRYQRGMAPLGFTVAAE